MRMSWNKIVRSADFFIRYTVILSTLLFLVSQTKSNQAITFIVIIILFILSMIIVSLENIFNKRS